MIVQESCADLLIKKIKERMTHLRLGDSLDKCIDMGAIVDPSQRKSVDMMVQEAKAEGAHVKYAYDYCFHGQMDQLSYKSNLFTAIGLSSLRVHTFRRMLLSSHSCYERTNSLKNCSRRSTLCLL